MASRMMAMVVAACLICGAGRTAAQTQTPQATPTPITIQGCVERVMPQGTKPAGPPQYKLIETAPATPTPRGTPPKPPVALESQYWLTAPASIDLGKFQNQRVEVMGTISPSPAPKPPATVPPDAPKSVFAALQVKMVSNECK
jgi:hypothetical protein